MSDPGLIDEPSLIPEAEETVRAIQRGAVDAVVVQAHGRFQVVTLTGADEPYRVLVERMSEGALTVSEDGIVMFVNRRLAEMAGRNVNEIVGQPFAVCSPVMCRQRIALGCGPPREVCDTRWTLHA